MTLLVVIAVAAERDAVVAALPAGADVRVTIGGVGPAAAAASTAAELARAEYDLVLSAGIAGGFAPAATGDIAVASRVVFADLGAETADGFQPISALGFGTDTYAVDPELAARLATLTGGRLGAVLTVATVTGTAGRSAALAQRYPDAVAEAMEGAGVAAAAVTFGVPLAEVRAVANTVGPRNRAAWDVPGALAALGRAIAAICCEAPWTP
ncbi:MAG: futalosine hydrolase [Pseudonocardiales bacterium]|nr:futalosine hydrolase [Pseudonocardiales bacterium]